MGKMTTLAISGKNFSKTNPDQSGDDWLAHVMNGVYMCGVLDGARSPHPGLQEISHYASDAFAALWLKQSILDKFIQNWTAPLSKLVMEANYAYDSLWLEILEQRNLRHTYLNRKINAPAAAFAFAMVRDGVLSIAQGADCVVCFVSADGKVSILAGDQFDQIAQEKREQMDYVPAQRLLKEGVVPEHVLALENQMIAKNRGLIYNQHGGLAVLNGEPTLQEVMFTDSMDVSAHLGTGAKVLVMSDGCYQKFDSKSEYATMIAAQLVAEEGIEGLLNALHMIGNPYPTDATAVLMEL